MIDEPESRREIHDSLADLISVMSITTNPTPIKAAVAMLGVEVGGLRLPMVEASEDELFEIRRALERHGLLSAV